jgi:hypothetical protein
MVWFGVEPAMDGDGEAVVDVVKEVRDGMIVFCDDVAF